MKPLKTPSGGWELLLVTAAPVGMAGPNICGLDFHVAGADLWDDQRTGSSSIGLVG